MTTRPIPFAPAAAALFLTCTHAAFAQPAATGSISGSILSEEGRTLRTTVSLSFAEAKGYPAPPRRTLTSTNGTFTFARLPAGRYVLCAHVAPSEPAPPESPYVDTCVWPSSQPPITLAAGQQTAGIVFTAPKGALLKIQVADPDHLLSQLPAEATAPRGVELELFLKGPDGLFRDARSSTNLDGGRTYQTTIPLNTAAALKIASPLAGVFDHRGHQVQERDEVALRSATPSDLTPVIFTLRRK